MQDKYVGDIGDFGKYGLLNEIFCQARRKIRLGINWYYVTRNETANSDGHHIAYLKYSRDKNRGFRECFPDLYDKLITIVREKRRCIANIESNRVLPTGTLFYSKPIPFSGASAEERTALRQAWFRESQSKLDQAEIIFLDPDNGIQLNRRKKGESNAVKYVFTDEIEAYFRSGKSLIIYNHRDRRPRQEYNRKILINQKLVSHPNDLQVIRFKRASVRDFIFLIQERHRDLLDRTISSLTSSPFDFLFDRYIFRKEAHLTKQFQYWTHPSVLKLAGNSDPIDVLDKKARSVVLDALQKGWKGPPYDPCKLAEYLKINTHPNSEVFEARTLPIGQGNVRIEYNPNKPRRRIRFSLAHELAHTLFPDCSKSVRQRLRSFDMRDDDWQLELCCNVAASEFLMPIGIGRRIEKEPVTVANILLLEDEYDVSTEAISLRLAHLTNEPCTIFVASRASDHPNAVHRIDYSVPSRTSTLDFPRGLQIGPKTILSECTAIGYTSKGTERWSSYPEINIECVGIPPFPNHRWPRIVGIARPASSTKSVPMQINYLRGDALEPRGVGSKIIAHIVNDKTPNWGAGFPRSLKKKWPDVQKDFSNWAHTYRKNFRLGEAYTSVLSDDLAIVHMVAQHGYGPSQEPRIRYAALNECLDKVASIASRRSATVHMPKIGTGQAGGNWDIIADLVDAILVSEDIGVTVYTLPGTSPNNNTQGELNLFDQKS